MTDAELTHIYQALVAIRGPIDDRAIGHAVAHLTKALALSWATHNRIALVMLQPCLLTGQAHERKVTQ